MASTDIALPKNIRDVIDEYEQKIAAAEQAVKDFEAAGDALKTAATVGAIRPRLRRCARSPCSTYCPSTLIRADRRAPRIHSLLTRLTTKSDEKCGLAPGQSVLTRCITISAVRTASLPRLGAGIR